jgi:hypothetical protein
LITGDDNSHIRLRRAAVNIDDREAHQDQSFLFSTSSPASEEQSRQQEKKGNDFCHIKFLISKWRRAGCVIRRAIASLRRY